MGKQIRYYKTDSGKEPFWSWFTGLDRKPRADVHTFLERVSLGGSANNVTAIKYSDPIKEIRVGNTGLRVYFVELGCDILVLLGGHKNSQRRDIKTANRYWGDYAKKITTQE